MRKVKYLVVAGALGLLTTLAPALPAHALDCASGPVSTVCTATLGTYCKLTHRSTCFP
jgi:hypothetical protein